MGVPAIATYISLFSPNISALEGSFFSFYRFSKVRHAAGRLALTSFSLLLIHIFKSEVKYLNL